MLLARGERPPLRITRRVDNPAAKNRADKPTRAGQCISWIANPGGGEIHTEETGHHRKKHQEQQNSAQAYDELQATRTEIALRADASQKTVRPWGSPKPKIGHGDRLNPRRDRQWGSPKPKTERWLEPSIPSEATRTLRRDCDAPHRRSPRSQSAALATRPRSASQPRLPDTRRFAGRGDAPPQGCAHGTLPL